MTRYKINIVVFLCVLACCTAVVFIFPTDARTIQRENRALNTLPALTTETLLSKEFANGLEPYLSDKVGYRASLIDAAQAMINLQGFAPDGVRVTNNTLVLPGRMMEIFTSSVWLETNYAEALKSYREELPEDVRVFAMLVPTVIEFQEERYKTVSDSEREAIDLVFEILRDAGIITVDVYYEMQARTGEYIYFNSDHHWTTLGAYYSYLLFAEAAGFEPVYISDYTEQQAEGFRGFLNNRVPYSGIDPDTIYWYEYPGLTVTTPLFKVPGEWDTVTFGIFIGGDQSEYVTETNSESGRTAVIVKDSYANAFIPWLAPHYSTIIAVDPRHFSGSVTEIAAQYDQVDFIFLNYVPATTYNDIVNGLWAIR